MHEIRIPRLGWSMEEGTFVGWLKQSGDEVAAGDPLYELEGEKALQEIESVDAGTLYIPPDAPQPGSVVSVGGLLGYLLAPGELPPPSGPPADDPGRSYVADTASGAAVAPPAPAAGPGVSRLARELGVELTELSSESPVSRITADQVLARAVRHSQTIPPASPAAAGRPERRGSAPIASPRARRVAAELGVDWTSLQGTGRGGRIREADIRRAAALRSAGAPRQPAPIPGAPRLSPRRQSIAANLRRSRDLTIPVTLTTSADATHLVALRAQYQARAAGNVPSYTDLAACLAARVLRRHPRLCVRWTDGHDSLLAVPEDAVDIGIAVDTPEGLVVPVVRDVARSSLLSVAAASRRLIDRARQGRLTAAETHGGVLTITNLGAYGIEAFTPVINAPQIAILGLGAIRRAAVVLADDRIAPQERITLSLTFDHAAVDGAPAAAFLRDLAAALEAPAPLLLGE